MGVDLRRYMPGNEKEIAAIHDSDFRERLDSYYICEERIRKLSYGTIVGLEDNRIVAYALIDMRASLGRAEMDEIHI